MGKMTPSAAKNAIRRALTGIVDPHPNASQLHRIWAFFKSSCAYCGRLLVRGNRDAHIDHLISSGAGGSNALGNLVLSCGTCNGDEKRDEPWESFLHKKAPDAATFDLRKSHIEAWVRSCGGEPLIDVSLRQPLAAEVEAAVAAFDKALERIRHFKAGP
jgi:5-methylcytosine-specific restriction endonuclease McrA